MSDKGTIIELLALFSPIIIPTAGFVAGAVTLLFRPSPLTISILARIHVAAIGISFAYPIWRYSYCKFVPSSRYNSAVELLPVAVLCWSVPYMGAMYGIGYGIPVLYRWMLGK